MTPAEIRSRMEAFTCFCPLVEGGALHPLDIMYVEGDADEIDRSSWRDAWEVNGILGCRLVFDGDEVEGWAYVGCENDEPVGYEAGLPPDEFFKRWDALHDGSEHEPKDYYWRYDRLLTDEWDSEPPVTR